MTKNIVLLILFLNMSVVFGQTNNWSLVTTPNEDNIFLQQKKDSVDASKISKKQAPIVQLLKLQDSLLKALSLEREVILEQKKNNLPRTDYYKNGQNGIELIIKNNSQTIIVSTFDSRPALKEPVATALFELYKSKAIINDTLLSIKTELALVNGNCKINSKDGYVKIDFYFQKIEWQSGLTEIHQGEEFVALPSSSPFTKPPLRKKINSKKKKRK